MVETARLQTPCTDEYIGASSSPPLDSRSLVGKFRGVCGHAMCQLGHGGSTITVAMVIALAEFERGVAPRPHHRAPVRSDGLASGWHQGEPRATRMPGLGSGALRNKGRRKAVTNWAERVIPWPSAEHDGHVGVPHGNPLWGARRCCARLRCISGHRVVSAAPT